MLGPPLYCQKPSLIKRVCVSVRACTCACSTCGMKIINSSWNIYGYICVLNISLVMFQWIIQRCWIKLCVCVGVCAVVNITSCKVLTEWRSQLPLQFAIMPLQRQLACTHQNDHVLTHTLMYVSTLPRLIATLTYHTRHTAAIHFSSSFLFYSCNVLTSWHEQLLLNTLLWSVLPKDF